MLVNHEECLLFMLQIFLKFTIVKKRKNLIIASYCIINICKNLF